MEKVDRYTITITNTKENGKIVNQMEKVNLYTQMAVNIKDNSVKECITEKEK